MHETQSNPITTRRSYPAAQQLLQEEHNVAEMRILKEPMHKHFQFSCRRWVFARYFNRLYNPLEVSKKSCYPAIS